MTGCHVMAKPAGSRCNLHCSYCFYLDKTQHPVMSEETLEVFIRQHIAAQPGDAVQFAWQGGEPTLRGLDFFRRVAELQQRYAGGKRIYNAFQTNGILLDAQWCHFFKQHQWLVGISLDGPAPIHDAMRVNRRGKPSHHHVQRAIETLKTHDVEFNLLVVVGRHNCSQPQRLYRYLRELGTPFLQFIPLLEMNDHHSWDDNSLSGKAWGAFLRGVFDVWVREDIGRIFVQIFDSTLAVWNGFASQMCSLSETCGHAFALESNGDVFQCDHYVYPAFRLGNIHHISLRTLSESQAASDFGQDKQRTLSAECRVCPVLRLCNGDCPKHRDNSGKSALCEGYRDFFSYTSSYMKVMRDLIRHHRSPMELMVMLNQRK